MKSFKPIFLVRAFYCLSLIIIFENSTRSQSPCNPSKNITTNPTAPVNTETPSLTNYFNWVAPSYQIRSQNYPFSTQIDNPYYQATNALMTQFVNSQDQTPDKGWELIKMDFGYDQNNTPTTHLAYNPKLILYNKYTGILRVFIARGDNYTSYNNMLVTISFNGSYFKTSALDLNRGVIPLDVPYASSQFKSLMTISNVPYTWMYADFPIAYDPCTCFYNSLLNIDVKYIITADIELHGTINGKLTSITSGSGTINTPSTHSLSFGEAVSAGNAFTKSYKDLDSYFSDQKKNLSDSASNILLNSQSKSNILSSLTSFTGLIKQSNFLQGTLSAVPYIGAALTFLNFFTGGGSNSSGPTQVQLLPTAVDLSAKLNGTISNTFPIESMDISTPGSKITGIDQSLFPLYNQTMGLVNLISTPQIYIASCFIDQCSGCDVSNGGTSYWLFRFKDPIKYVLNPAAKVRISSVQAAIVIEGGFTVDATCNSWPGINNQNLAPNWNTNWSFEGSRVDSNTTTGFKTKYSQYRTDYVNAHCLNDLIAKYSNYEDFTPGGYCNSTLAPKNFYIKLLFDFQRLDTTANSQHILQVYKFPIKIGAKDSYSNNDGPPTYCFDPINDCLNHETVSNSCASDFFIQNTDAEISSFCNTTIYTQNRLSISPKNNSKDIFTKNSNPFYDLSISPNPATKEITTHFTLSKTESFILTLYNATGNPVKTISGNSSGYISRLFNVSDLIPGFYFIELNVQGIRQVRKVIIQKN